MTKRDPPIRAKTGLRRSGESVQLPVHAETAVVHITRRERGRVRVSKTREERQVIVTAPAVKRDVVVERVPIDRFVEHPTGVRQEGDTLVIPVFEEVPVVVMKTKLKEEVRVTTRTSNQSRRTPISIRRETVTVDRLPAEHNHNDASPKERGPR